MNERKIESVVAKTGRREDTLFSEEIAWRNCRDVICWRYVSGLRTLTVIFGLDLVYLLVF